MSKVITCSVVRNEMSNYVTPWLSTIRAWADLMVIVDNGSVDGTWEFLTATAREDSRIKLSRYDKDTFHNSERAVRTALWDSVHKLAQEGLISRGDWIVVLDADELISKTPAGRTSPSSFGQHLKGLPTNVNALFISLYNLWSPTQYRIDKFWGPSLKRRIFRYYPEYFAKGMRDVQFACGEVPEAALNCSAAMCSEFGLVHWSYVRPEARKSKHAFYMDVDGGKYHDLGHLQSIIDPCPQLTPWDGEPWPAEWCIGKYAGLETPKYSILIPVCDGVDETRGCIDSIETHTKDYEVLIMDNGSGKEMQDYLATLQARNHSIHAARSETNLGFIKALNLLAKEARGQYIISLNNDTVVGPGWADRMAEALEDPRIGQVGPSGFAVHQDTGGCHPMPGIWDYIEGWCFMIPRGIYEKFGLFDEENLDFAYCEDSDLSLRIQNGGFLIKPVSTPVRHLHAKTRNRLAGSGLDLASCETRNRAYIVKKWHSLLFEKHNNPNWFFAKQHVLVKVVPPAASINVIKPNPQHNQTDRKYLFLQGGYRVGDTFHLIPILRKLSQTGIITWVTGPYESEAAKWVASLPDVRVEQVIVEPETRMPGDISDRVSFRDRLTQKYKDLYPTHVMSNEVRCSFEIAAQMGTAMSGNYPDLTNIPSIPRSEGNYVVVQFGSISTQKSFRVNRPIRFEGALADMPVYAVGWPNEPIPPGAIDCRGWPLAKVSNLMAHSRLNICIHSAMACLSFYLYKKMIVIHFMPGQFRFSSYHNNITDLVQPTLQQLEMTIPKAAL